MCKNFDLKNYVCRRCYDNTDLVNPQSRKCYEEYIEIEEKCVNCRYFHKYKRFTSNGWEEESCCTVNAQEGEDKYEYNSSVIRVGEYDMCEDFYRRDE